MDKESLKIYLNLSNQSQEAIWQDILQNANNFKLTGQDLEAASKISNQVFEKHQQLNKYKCNSGIPNYNTQIQQFITKHQQSAKYDGLYSIQNDCLILNYGQNDFDDSLANYEKQFSKDLNNSFGIFCFTFMPIHLFEYLQLKLKIGLAQHSIKIISLFDTNATNLRENCKQLSFLVQIKKIQQTEQNSLSYEINNEIFSTFNKLLEELKNIVSLKYTLQTNINHLQESQRFLLKIKNNLNQYLYNIAIIDTPDKTIAKKSTCGCFLVPIGEENRYNYSYQQGQFDLLQQTQLSRLIIVSVCSGYYVTLEQIQLELNNIISLLIQNNCNNLPVQFITDGKNLGIKKILLNTEDYIIEEFQHRDSNEIYRRLILKSNIEQIQSQVKIIYHSAKNKNKEYLKKYQNINSILEKKKNCLIGIDSTYLDCEYQQQIIAGLFINYETLIQDLEIYITILGGGAFVLSKFLSKYIKNCKIKTVEIDKDIINISSDYFELELEATENFQIINDDALVYIEEESQLHNKILQDYIIIDINSNDIFECNPPAPFCDPKFLHKIYLCLKSNGILLINFTQKSMQQYIDTIEKLKTKFNIIYKAYIESTDSFIIYAQKTTSTDQLTQNQMISSELILKNYSSVMKSRLDNWNNNFDLKQLINQICIEEPNFIKQQISKNEESVQKKQKKKKPKKKKK